MKTNVISVKNTGEGVEEALLEVERFAGYQQFDHKETLRLRLLTEEMMGMVKGIVGDFKASFWAEGQGRDVKLCLEASTYVDQEQREELLSVSTSGKNYAHRTFMGKVTGLFEYCLSSDGAPVNYYGNYPDFMYYDMSGLGFERMWTLQNMRADLEAHPEDMEKQEEWDELEKSIVAKLADEVIVGVKSRKVQMIIKKSF